jgi:Fe-S cluster assembly protein SufD
MSALLDSFATAFDALAARDAAGLRDSRQAALDAALRDGIPHARVEAWKYTPLRSLERRVFKAADAAPASFDAALLADIRRRASSSSTAASMQATPTSAGCRTA